MKSKHIILVLLAILTLNSCSKRNDQIFGASDELHLIQLYKKDKTFKMLYNGLNTAIGNYILIGDTVKLTYTENQFKEFDPNQVLTRTLLIHTNSKSIKSIDTRQRFCAVIHLDRRGTDMTTSK